MIYPSWYTERKLTYVRHSKKSSTFSERRMKVELKFWIQGVICKVFWYTR